MAFFMFWEVLWPLVLGFLISAVVQSMVSRAAVGRVLGRDGLRGATIATLRTTDQGGRCSRARACAKTASSTAFWLVHWGCRLEKSWRAKGRNCLPLSTSPAQIST